VGQHLDAPLEVPRVELATARKKRAVASSSGRGLLGDPLFVRKLRSFSSTPGTSASTRAASEASR
jgi:hypothetical protein